MIGVFSLDYLITWFNMRLGENSSRRAIAVACVYCERGKERIGYHKLDVLPATLALERLPSHGQTQ